MKSFRAKFDGQAFWPTSGWDELKALPANGPAMILSIELPRSPQHHARTFALYRNGKKKHDG